MRIGLDTNVLAYDIGIDRHPDDAGKIAAIGDLLTRVSQAHELMVPLQALGELYVVQLRAGQSREVARIVINECRARFAAAASRSSSLDLALELATDHKLQFWDSLILSACSEAGCAVVLSEDMGHGFRWRGLTVVNPFAADADRLLGRLLP